MTNRKRHSRDSWRIKRTREAGQVKAAVHAPRRGRSRMRRALRCPPSGASVFQRGNVYVVTALWFRLASRISTVDGRDPRNPVRIVGRAKLGQKWGRARPLCGFCYAYCVRNISGKCVIQKPQGCDKTEQSSERETEQAAWTDCATKPRGRIDTIPTASR